MFSPDIDAFTPHVLRFKGNSWTHDMWESLPLHLSMLPGLPALPLPPYVARCRVIFPLEMRSIWSKHVWSWQCVAVDVAKKAAKIATFKIRILCQNDGFQSDFNIEQLGDKCKGRSGLWNYEFAFTMTERDFISCSVLRDVSYWRPRTLENCTVLRVEAGKK